MWESLPARNLDRGELEALVDERGEPGCVSRAAISTNA